MHRELSADEAEVVINGINVAEGRLRAGRDFYYEIEGQNGSLTVGLVVDYDKDGVTLADVNLPDNTQHTVTWDSVRAITVRGYP